LHPTIGRSGLSVILSRRRCSPVIHGRSSGGGGSRRIAVLVGSRVAIGGGLRS